MKRKILRFSLIVYILSILLTACRTSSTPEPTNIPPVPTTVPETPLPTEEPKPEPEPISVIDDLGAEIILETPAQTIISISPNLTEILFGIGAGDRLIGRDSNSQYPESALEAVDLGAMWDGIPVEDILALEPDLILAGEIFAPDAIQELRDLGLNVYWQANPHDFEGLFSNIMDISVLTGTEVEADELVISLNDRVVLLEEKLESVENIPLVFYELDASEPAMPWTTGADTFISYIISKAKGKNLGDVLEGEWVQISSEELISQNPDYILLADALYGITPESVAERPGWNGISAVVNNKLFPFDPFILSVPGPRLVDGFELVAELLHSELFGN
ncbi:MAG: ABC transporter substrate-binding protein [Anaerolineales bacterium]